MFPFTVIITRKSDGQMMFSYDVDAPSSNAAKDGVWEIFKNVMLARGRSVSRRDFHVTAAPHGM